MNSVIVHVAASSLHLHHRIEPLDAPVTSAVLFRSVVIADAIAMDLGIPDGGSLLAKQVRFIVGDRLDVLLLNAGISKSAPVLDYTVEDFDNLFATNVRGPFFLVQQLLPVLGEGSNIVVISSLGARMVVGKPGLENRSILAYASTKGALETLVKNWAAILGPSGIRVNAVAPGVIDTDISNFTKTEAGREIALGMPAGELNCSGRRSLEGREFFVEHWDVIQDEATEQQSKSGNPMFGNSFPK